MSFLEQLRAVTEQRSAAVTAAFGSAPSPHEVELMAGYVAGLHKAALTMAIFATGGKFSQSDWNTICETCWQQESAEAFAAHAMILAQTKEHGA